MLPAGNALYAISLIAGQLNYFMPERNNMGEFLYLPIYHIRLEHGIQSCLQAKKYELLFEYIDYSLERNVMMLTTEVITVIVIALKYDQEDIF